MKNMLTFVQEDTTAVVDTLTQAYSQMWEGVGGAEDANPLLVAAASYDLIFIVLGVSLIIWFVLLFFIIKVDRKISKLEADMSQKPKIESDEA